MDLSAYRASPTEQTRIASLFSLMPKHFANGLDIGARDGYISLRMAERSDHVTALDLSRPQITHEKITCVEGNAAKLDFDDDRFDVVICAEVLEHIPSPSLELACKEIARVTKKWAVIGVPLNQDIRFGATRCPTCGKTNPPWGHVNSFTLEKLAKLFSPLKTAQVDYVGETDERTNVVAHSLMKFAGHPFGTYSQEEPCIYCGSPITYIDQRNLVERLATRMAHLINKAQKHLTPKQPIWVHVLFEKQ
jgi:SAM-dependent methyltransferase